MAVKHKAERARPVDRAFPLVFCLGTGNHQPLITCAFKIHARKMERELALPSRYIGAFLVFGDKAKRRFAGE